MPRVTTIIPAYNAVDFLSTAIDSALAQTAPSTIVVVDDGSTDNTREVLDSYGGKIQVIHQSNQGLSVARNVGIDAAKTEFVALLDADDVWLDNKLQLQLELYDANPDFELVHGLTNSWYSDSDEQTSFVDADQSLYTESCFSKLFMKNAICVSSTMFRRQTAIRLGKFDEEIRRPTTQDHDFWLRIAWQHQIGFVDKLCVLYRRHASNASQETISMLEDRAYVLEKAISYGKEALSQNLDHQHIWDRLAHTCYLAGYQHFQRGNFVESKKWLRKAYQLGRRNIRSFCGSILPTPILRLVHQHVA